MKTQCKQPARNASLDSTSVAGGCSKTFEVTSTDLEFYNKMQVPAPTHCPDCRNQRRMVWRNERILYERKCDLCSKALVSIYDPAGPYIVYCYECWYSDKWDALDYAQEIDLDRPFFEQFKELQIKVPRIYALVVDNENSEYTNGSAYNKDCFLIFVSDHNEDAMYSYGIYNTVSSIDMLNCNKCEMCYYCIGCTNCYDVQYSVDSANCNSSMFLIDCKGSNYCFMSYGLRNQEYVWKNKQLTKEEYNEKFAALKRGSYGSIQKLKEDFRELKLKHTFKYYHGLNNEKFSGDYLERCANTYESFESYELDSCKFITHGNKIKDSYDGYVNVDQGELTYEITSGISLYNTKFSYSFWHGKDSEYCDSCNYSDSLFGCVGMRKGKYSILNKQYSEEEYKKVKEKLIEHMSAKGGSASGGKQEVEYGEFFPAWVSPFSYNETVAQDHFPLKKEDVISRDWNWKDTDEKEVKYSTYRVPDNIETAKDDITKTFLTCESCKKNYRILQNELAFYRKQNIPIPRTCFDCRHIERLHDRNPHALWHRQCMCSQPDHDHEGQCPREFETAYSTDNPTIVYCEECYVKEVV
ncbi:MAG: hypothetical protein Q8P90_06170 [bacterium]|nr:hypothetical protein [bacterium]